MKTKNKPEEQVWTHTDGSRIVIDPHPYSMVHEEKCDLKNGAKIRVLRFLNRDWGIEATRKEGAAQVVTKIVFSEEAMEAILGKFKKMKDKPVSMEVTYKVYPVIKKKKKK